MTAAAFERCCAAAKREAKEYTSEAKFALGKSKLIVFNPACLSCTGPPPELTIIEIPPPSMQRENPMSSDHAKTAPTPVTPTRSVDIDVNIRLERQVANLVEALREDYCASEDEIAALLKV